MNILYIWRKSLRHQRWEKKKSILFHTPLSFKALSAVLLWTQSYYCVRSGIVFDSGFSFYIRNSKCTYSVCLCAILQRMYLVTELCEGGDLNDLLQKNKHFTEEETKHIIKSLSEAIVYLHKKGNAHKTQTPPKIAHIFKSHTMAWIPLFPSYPIIALMIASTLSFSVITENRACFNNEIIMNNCQTKYQPILIESEGFIWRCLAFFSLSLSFSWNLQLKVI